MSSPYQPAPAALQRVAVGAATRQEQANTMADTKRSDLLSLPVEIKLMIAEKLPDAKSVGALMMTCKKMYETLGAEQEDTRMVQAVLLSRGAQGFVGLTQAVTTVTMPPISTSVFASADNMIKAIRASRGDRPVTIDNENNNFDFNAFAQLYQPHSQGATVQGRMRMVRMVGELLLEPGSVIGGSCIPNPQDIQAWRKDKTIASLTLAQARQLVGLGQYVHRFSIWYFNMNHIAWRFPHFGPSSEKSMKEFENALWLFEAYCHVLGGDYWWKRWQHSVHLESFVRAFRRASGPPGRLRTVHRFFVGVVECKLEWLAWKWMAPTTQCKCRQPQLFRNCTPCRSRCVEGALSMGLAAVWRIMEAKVNNLEGLSECFVWEDDLPRQHPYFLQYFLNVEEEPWFDTLKNIEEVWYPPHVRQSSRGRCLKTSEVDGADH
ncbi:hypothetical protein SLS53_007860 [Cytospora paraplurivora]|uniref:F-box domain-containing protein n=1 Tax=Cytospora paraplurivora TaxID=2898453 RepID=A0AAN9U0I0_9PEZI